MKCFWGSFASSLSILCLLYLCFSSSFQAASAGQAGGGSSVADYLTEDLFEAILKNRNDPICPARGFYTYESFLEAAKNFSDFGTTGDQETRKREIAAFFGLTSYLTSPPGTSFSHYILPFLVCVCVCVCIREGRKVSILLLILLLG